MSDTIRITPKKAETLYEALSVFQLCALETADDFDQFYVEAAEARNADEYDRTKKTMVAIKASKSPCHILFSGHKGCGKSTELYRLYNMFKNDGYLVAIGRCDSNLNMNTMEYTDLILFILETLFKCAQENDLAIDESILKSIESYWNKIHEIVKEKTGETKVEGSISANVKSPSLLARVLSLTASFRSDLSLSSKNSDVIRETIKPRLDLFYSIANDFINNIQISGVQRGFKDTFPIVLIDQLEKANIEVLINLFENHSQDLTKLQSHLVFPFPIEMCYKPSYHYIKNYFTEEWVLPMIKLRTWDEQTHSYVEFNTGKTVLRSIVEKRMNINKISDGILDDIINKTGGYLRNLFEAIYDAILNSIARGSDIVETQDMTVALNSLQSSITRRLDEKNRFRLEMIINGDKKYGADDVMMDFLSSGIVFEYNGDRWVDLHPLVEDWIIKTRAFKT